jgi:5-formyltetrahydrofolate cyclo-ligase
MNNPAKLRKSIRAHRRALSKQQKRRNSLAACRHFINTLALIRCKKIALYLAADSELDPQPLLKKLLRLNKTIYLPILRPANVNALWFSEYRINDPLRSNRYGILEPNYKLRKPIPTWGLDLIVMPLVAFSNDGTRLGMGGGYYDRTLSYQNTRLSWIKPKLVGYAHECQRTHALPKRHWDIPLHAIITEQGYQSFID